MRFLFIVAFGAIEPFAALLGELEGPWNPDADIGIDRGLEVEAEGPGERTACRANGDLGVENVFTGPSASLPNTPPREDTHHMVL